MLVLVDGLPAADVDVVVFVHPDAKHRYEFYSPSRKKRGSLQATGAPLGMNRTLLLSGLAALLFPAAGWAQMQVVSTSPTLNAMAPNARDLLASIGTLADAVRENLANGSTDVLKELKSTSWKPSTSSFEALRLYNEGQQLTRAEALRLYTSENGWFFHEESSLGTIEPGRLGDVVVLSDDYFDPKKVPDEAIKLAKLDPGYVRATADEHCSGLMQQHFPEVLSPG
jgi:hypothetical protein